MMDTDQLQHFRNQIESAIAELKTALKDGEESTAPVQLDTSIGRLSRMDAMQSQQMARALKQRQREHLQRLEHALERIDDGTYGRCRRCRGDIGLERLNARPDAVLCVQCADNGR